MIIDVLLLIALFYLALYVRVALNQYELPSFSRLEVADFSFVIFIIFALMHYEKIYSLRYDFWQETFKVFKSLILAYFIVLALLMLSKFSLDYSRLFISLYFILAFLLLPIGKRIAKRVIYNFPFFKKRVLVIGDREKKEIIKKELNDNWYLGMAYSHKNYDSVIIASQGMNLDELNAEIDSYLKTQSSVYIVPYVTGINFANSNIMEYSNIRINTLQIENKLLIKRNILLKSVFELLAVIFILPIFILLHLIISIIIKLDSNGPIFFKQHRLGKNNNDFVCYKYRTMYKDSDTLLQEYLTKHPEEIEYYAKYHKYINDPRITKVGHFLRVSSLDELAQIINVLKGEMSLVGPRPYMLCELEKLAHYQHFILRVKPGITGLWQVSGRNELTFKERKELEVWYIKNWSLWADFVILVKTIKVVLSKVGAK